MVQLIIVVLAIALLGLLLTATVNYIPWWYKTAADIEEVIRKSLSIVEQGYDVATRATDGTPPAVTTAADGGFAAGFTPVLKVLPAAPPGFTWVYGQRTTNDVPNLTGLNWFCLRHTATGGGNEGAWRGSLRAAAVFSNSQYFINSECGAASSLSAPTSYPAPLAITFYVAYVPGINK